MIATALVVGGALLGLSSAPHCAGMCGPLQCGLLGIRPATSTPSTSRLANVLAANAGRLTVYAAFGALAGTFGAFGQGLFATEKLRLGLRLLAALALVASAVKLAGYTDILAPFERVSAPLFRGVRRIVAPLLPGVAGQPESPFRAFAAGLLWGTVPCAVVWGAILAATGAGGPLGGALVLLAFGVATLPALLGVGLLTEIAARFAPKLGSSRLLAVPVAALALYAGGSAIRDYARPHACCDSGKAASAIVDAGR
jgi:hypothetical protein